MPGISCASVFEFFTALNLLFNFLAFDNPGGLGHFSDGTVRSEHDDQCCHQRPRRAGRLPATVG